MSFILDALKKSETERKGQGPAEFANIPSSSDEPGAPRWLWALALLLAINVAVLLGMLMRNDTPEIAQPTVTEDATPDVQASFAAQVEDARDRQPVAVAGPDTSLPSPSPVLQAPAETPQPAFTLRAMPTAGELRANGTIQMAELHLDIHVYSETPSDRFVFINMVRHQENSRLAEGPVVREITPEGVILDYRGTEFLLPRE